MKLLLLHCAHLLELTVSGIFFTETPGTPQAALDLLEASLGARTKATQKIPRATRSIAFTTRWPSAGLLLVQQKKTK
ncbi:hypothetical protein GUJ93_ZPchr0002g22976 [Zizania palustris]|uniref:Secreted protein n=1 Tax=Zizania palustris TaxID=103762 RepID=A0A8J5S3M0_ZIZPA|nr:hypothetical protein GUJ93_ZPchr0002g22976 [Zizania palustris]